jgi:hypothetical protein
MVILALSNAAQLADALQSGGMALGSPVRVQPSETCAEEKDQLDLGYAAYGNIYGCLRARADVPRIREKT